MLRKFSDITPETRILLHYTSVPQPCSLSLSRRVSAYFLSPSRVARKEVERRWFRGDTQQVRYKSNSTS